MLRSRTRVEIYEFDPFRLDMVSRRLFLLDKPIPLPAKTFDVLRILVENHGQLVSKEKIIRQIWEDRFVEENNLAVRISALRKILAETAENRLIETVSGYGYRFAARVREISNARLESEAEALRTIAVLPLINENNQQRLNYLCDGITESLINSLSQLANLKVISRTTAFRYKGKDVDPLVVGRELGVGAVLVGNINQSSSHLVFNIEMVDVYDASRLWGALYKRRVSDLSAFEEEVVREVSDCLRIKLSKVEENRLAKRHTGNSEAYHLYMKGRYFWNRRTATGVRRSIKYYTKAIKRDPQYALAYTGLAEAYETMSRYGFTPPRKTMPKARAAALQALEINDRLAEAHVSLGIIKLSFEWDWSGAESAFRRAIDLSPNNATAHHYYSTLLAKLGRLDEAVAEVRKAFDLDPLSLHIRLALARILYFSKQYDAAIEHCREMLELDAKFWPAHALAGLVYLEQKDCAGAIAEYKKIISFPGDQYSVSGDMNGLSKGEESGWSSDPEAIGILGYAYGEAGEHSMALKFLNRLEHLSKKRYVEPQTLALVYIGLKDYDKAFEWLEKAFADRTSSLTYLKVWSFFNRLREDSRYVELVKRIGL